MYEVRVQAMPHIPLIKPGWYAVFRSYEGAITVDYCFSLDHLSDAAARKLVGLSNYQLWNMINQIILPSHRYYRFFQDIQAKADRGTSTPHERNVRVVEEFIRENRQPRRSIGFTPCYDGAEISETKGRAGMSHSAHGAYCLKGASDYMDHQGIKGCDMSAQVETQDKPFIVRYSCTANLG